MKSIPTTRARRFEYSGGTSHKFWEIATVGTEVTIRFGRIGTAGQTQVKSFPDAVAASKHVEKLITKKVNKGYVPVG